MKKKEEEKSAKTIIFGALRKISGGSRKSSKVNSQLNSAIYFFKLLFKESKCCPEALPEDLCRYCSNKINTKCTYEISM